MSQEIPSFASAQMGAPEEVPLVKGTEEWAQHEPVNTVDPKDADTPDNWVHRHPAIQRLTGRHPLNCEPTVEMLMASGFITPVSLHYVRNHGAAPKLDWSSHRVEVNGLVDKPTTFSMDDILKLPTVTIPVTLVCAGNRRKEENMLKKSIGFNWGPCAVSTGYWTGVRLSDVLKHVGVKGVDQGAQYVSFRGPRAELPKGDDGSYGTSLLLSYVMDPSTDVILAYKHNGRWLTPDHGYPIRIIIPGFIGGRMVKWLSEITVTPQESDNFYHYHDNRVMPPHVDEALAKEEGWWFKPDFIINELNINSAITTPAHDEVVPLASNLPYMAKGYAYTGGGRKIIRVEISTDDATTWRQAEIKRFEKPNAYGKHWCWVMWEFPLQTIELLNCKELLVRAWDSSMNGQPAVITWNLMGMMNNCYFRIRIHPHTDAAGNIGLRFQHPAPVTPGPLGNIGWREEENLARQGEAPPAPAAAVVAAPVAKAGDAQQKTWFTMEEVAGHNTEESAWFVHEGKVYDATPFLDEHPGGAESILISTGMDATDEFNSIHSSKAKGMLAQYLLGDLVDADEAARRSAAAAPSASTPAAAPSATAAPVASTSAAASTELVALNPREKIAFRLAEKIELSHNVRLFRFALQSPQHRFGLPVGKHVFLYATIGGETVMRAYTPTSSDDELGHFDLVVKIYRAGEHPRFPDGGKMSQHLDTLAVGDTIDAKGPVGHFVYTARGAFTNNRKPGTARRFSMIAGGTGITPCYQVIKAVLKDAEDKTELALLYANQTEDDILLREELDALAAAHPNFKVWYTLDRPPAEGWAYSSGFINEDMLRDNLFPAGDDTLCLMCGPPPMLKFACVPNLLKLGYKEEHLVNF